MPNGGVKRGAFITGLWYDNPVFRQVLGICSTLAVTNLLTNTLVMCLGLVYTVVLSNVTMSLLRNVTPRRIRIMVQVLIISFYVILLHLVLQAFLPEISRSLGPYVGLIITNCIVQGRLEAYAMSNGVWPSFLDGLGCSFGYAFILLGIAVVREPAGFGSLFGYTVLGAWWTKWTLMAMPSGAFFMLALFVWFFRNRTSPQEAPKK